MGMQICGLGLGAEREKRGGCGEMGSRLGWERGEEGEQREEISRGAPKNVFLDTGWEAAPTGTCESTPARTGMSCGIC